MENEITAYQDQSLCWAASLSCCVGIVGLLFAPRHFSYPLYESKTFLPTYAVGILAWLFHGINLRSPALIVPCAIQIVALLILLKRSITFNQTNKT